MSENAIDSETQAASSVAMLRRLRALIGSDDTVPAESWRDDLRLFALTWAAGFLFFVVMLA